MELEAHEISNIFPLIKGEAFNELVADIRKNGLIKPIITYQGKILDGRNRYNACIEANIKPHTVNYQGNDPINYVISLNVHRRHLASDQRAAAAIEAEYIADRFRLEAKQRQVQSGGDKVSQEYKAVVQKIEQPVKPNDNKVNQKLAETFGTNRQYIADIRKVKETQPDTFEAIKQGEVKLTHVQRQLRRTRLIKHMANIHKDKSSGTFKIEKAQFERQQRRARLLKRIVFIERISDKSS